MSVIFDLSGSTALKTGMLRHIEISAWALSFFNKSMQVNTGYRYINKCKFMLYYAQLKQLPETPTSLDSNSHQNVLMLSENFSVV